LIKDTGHYQKYNANQNKEHGLDLDSPDRGDIDNECSDVICTQSDEIVDEQVPILDYKISRGIDGSKYGTTKEFKPVKCNVPYKP
jgi:hypothetical protein